MQNGERNKGSSKEDKSKEGIIAFVIASSNPAKILNATEKAFNDITSFVNHFIIRLGILNVFLRRNCV